ncbi:DUF3802 family protein [Veronia pacifica]|uniref:Topoisomerase II n=1 Tax=Veronia pacifica TaxID=1080227 RepID=A0A1C3ECP2_9GAMM|nr:DUF3802 family protein [Veronia pacifica]ODA30954.1 topoisomerase II [Veronia pacifica]
MVVDTDGYNALVDFFMENMDKFEVAGEPDGEITVDEFVHDLLVEQLMAICDQNKSMKSEIRFMVMREADIIIADLEQALCEVWQKVPSKAQKDFLSEFIGLIKNMFDASVSEFSVSS